MIKFTPWISATLLLLVPPTLANNYLVASVGYATVDSPLVAMANENIETDDVAIGLAYGYQFHRQWYAEAGYLKLADKQEGSAALESDAPFIAVLGKAGNQTGELFYRLGITSVKTRTTRYAEAGICDVAEGCTHEARLLGGMVGLGFDYYMGLKSMLRVEYTYIGGQDDFNAHLVNVGLRYNF